MAEQPQGRHGAPADPPIPRRAAPAGFSISLLQAGMIVLAAYNLGLALFMTVAPHAFFTSIGPFEDVNRHYIRDVATYSASMGFGFLVALRRPSWRVPLLAISTVQFGLHTVNHLVDASMAHPQWTGWFDFVSLLASTALLAWMWRSAARREANAGTYDGRHGPPVARASLSSPSPSPQAQRSTT